MDTLDARHASIRRRIASIRQALTARGLAALVVPSSDPHLSEYLPDRWKGREWLSGFTGSVGTLIVTADFAGVWVDSRYWMQAEVQLAGSGVELVKVGSAGSLAHIEWLAENMPTFRELANLFGGPGFSIRSEFTLLRFERGVLGMASSGKDTEGSQFFITHSMQPHLDGAYTTFGWVESGMDLVDRLEEEDRVRTARVEPAGQ